MKVLHLLSAGGIGGIEILCKDIFSIANWDNRICFLFEEGEIYQELKQNEYKVFSLKQEMRNKKRIVNKLVEYCKKEKIDIITVHHGGASCNIICMMLKNKLPNIKYVRYLHASFDKYAFGNGENGIKNYLIKRIMQKTFYKCDSLIFISNYVKKSFEKNFDMKNTKKNVVYNGINSKFFEDLKDRKNDERCTNIVFIGRLEKVKGVNILLHAYSKIVKENSNINLTIVGDGSERKKLEKMTKDLRIDEKVKFMGKQKNVIKYLDEASIFVYPSVWEEGFGISVVEAMARGLITITFKKGALPEIIKDGQNGFIVENENSDELANKIMEVINLNTLNKNAIVQNAISTSQNFTIRNTIKQLEKVYKELI